MKKRRAAEDGGMSHALDYARQNIVDTACAAIGYVWMNDKECERGGYHLDDDEEAMLCSKDNLCTHNVKGNLVGTSLASRVRSFWEQGSHDSFRAFEEEALVDTHLVAKLVEDIGNE